MSKQNYTNILLFVTVALIWSSSFLFIKLAVDTVPPVTIAAIRLILASLILYFYLIILGEKLGTRWADWRSFLFIGFFGNALPFALIGFGEKSIDSSTAAILMGIMPITTVLLAHLTVSEEPFTKKTGIGIVLGFMGLMVLLGFDAISGLNATTTGQLSVLSAAICYAINTVYVRKNNPGTGPKLATGSLICGALMVTPISLLIDKPWMLQPSTESTISVIILSVFATAIATVMYFRLVKNLGAATMSQINYVIPVLGTIWGVSFMGDELKWSSIIALVLVVCGVVIISGQKRSKSPKV